MSKCCAGVLMCVLLVFNVLSKVYMGQNLNFTVGKLQYTSADDSTSIPLWLIVVLVIVLVALVLLFSIIAVYICIRKNRHHPRKPDVTNLVNDVSMYTSPAYGSHQIFTEPGLDHLYESLDNWTGFWNAIEQSDESDVEGIEMANEDDGASDVDEWGYLKMRDIIHQDNAPNTCNDDNTGYVNDDFRTSSYLHLVDPSDNNHSSSAKKQRMSWCLLS